MQQQIPPLRCGMTNKKGTARTRTATEADSFTALRNDKKPDAD
jgi:hypothetical protein